MSGGGGSETPCPFTDLIGTTSPYCYTNRTVIRVIQGFFIAASFVAFSMFFKRMRYEITHLSHDGVTTVLSSKGMMSLLQNRRVQFMLTSMTAILCIFPFFLLNVLHSNDHQFILGENVPFTMFSIAFTVLYGISAYKNSQIIFTALQHEFNDSVDRLRISLGISQALGSCFFACTMSSQLYDSPTAAKVLLMTGLIGAGVIVSGAACFTSFLFKRLAQTIRESIKETMDTKAREKGRVVGKMEHTATNLEIVQRVAFGQSIAIFLLNIPSAIVPQLYAILPYSISITCSVMVIRFISSYRLLQQYEETAQPAAGVSTAGHNNNNINIHNSRITH